MAPRARYAELHLHTAFSFLDGASLPEELAQRAADLELPAVAVTDHDGLYGAMEFAKAMSAVGVQPITGAEMTLTDGTHLTLLAETRIGYANLCRLLTESHRHATPPHEITPPPEHGLDLTLRAVGRGKTMVAQEQRLPRLDPALIPHHGEGLILLTGCRQGALARAVDAGGTTAADALLARYIDWVGAENVVVEVQHNLVHGDTPRRRALVELAARHHLFAAATGNVHYHHPDRARLNDVLTAIRTHTTLDGSHRDRRPNTDFHMKSEREMRARFRAHQPLIDATWTIAERCRRFDLSRDLAYVFPDYPVDPGDTPEALLTRLTMAELDRRYPPPNEIAASRLREELAVITKHRLAGFFLLYRDLLLLAREVADEVRGTDTPRAAAHLPPGRGRGSSVSSIVCYLIGLSHVDPLKHNLFFGRFLNDELNSIPDIDLDFPREIRERLIERVYERYGRDHAALVCAFSTYRLRSAVRDVGKALGLPMADIDKIAKLSEPRSALDLGQELARIPGYERRKDAPPWKYLVEIATDLSGFPRHASQHPGGMVISSQPIHNLMPVQPAAMAGRYIAQWDKDSCEDARVVKIDFLSLGMLSMVEECLELIAAGGKGPIDLSRIDFDDPAIYDMICRGDTMGVFQIESRAQIQMLPRTQPRKLEDLVVQVAIVRPGPIIGGAVAPYVEHRLKSKHGFLPIEPQYDHPSLEPVLRETHGVILYQEQVLQVSMTLAGFTAGQADQLRRSMTRKRSRDAMLALWKQFRDGAAARGVDVETSKTVFKKLLGFASYGFPKSHAAAFAILAYQSCWLKWQHPAEFTCALLNNQPMGFYPPHVLINDAKRHGLRVFPPDVDLSGIRCSVEGNAIRVGLGFVDGLGEEPARRIVLERLAHGSYRSLADFVRRVPLKTAALENLISIGAFDRFGLGRREALWLSGLFLASRAVGQTPGTEKGRQLGLMLPVEQDRVDLRPMSAWEQMAADYDVLGMSPRYHPLGLLRPTLPERLLTSADLATIPHDTEVAVAGLIVCRQRPGTAKGVVFLLLEDERGLINVILYRDLYERQRMVVRGEPFVVVEGTAQWRGGALNIIARTIMPLREGRKAFQGYPEQSYDEDERVIADAQTPQHDLADLSPASHNYR
jgi:error-prone DNA polymerase